MRIAIVATSCFDSLLPLYKHLYSECDTDLFCFICDRFMSHPSFDITAFPDGTNKVIESVPSSYIPRPILKYLDGTEKNVKAYVFRITLTSYASLSRRIRKIVSPENYDIVHFIGSSFIYEAMLRPGRRSYRVMVSLHEADPYRIRNSMLHPKEFIKWAHGKIMYSLISRADYISFFSLNEKEKFLRKFPRSESRCGVIKFGLQETFMHYDPVDCGVSPKRDFILYIGMIRPYKGVDFLIETIRRSEKLSDIDFIVAGRNDMGLDTTMLPNVRIIDRFLSEYEINYLVKRSKAVILPYKGASQSGVPGISFFHCKPLIFSDVRGLDEYLYDGYNGISFRSGDGDSLEKAVLRIYDPQVYDSLLTNIKTNPYMEDLSWRTLAGQYAGVYEKLVKNEA